MQTLRKLNSEWKEWILQNLGRGCSPESIVEAMVAGGFAEQYAQAAVHVLELDARMDYKYKYETPRLTAQGNFIETADRTIRVSAQVDRPFIAMLDGVLAHEECDMLIEMSRERLGRSLAVDPTTGEGMKIKERTSKGAYFARGENEFISTIDRRIAAIMNCPVENGESLQILNYGIGAEYRPHHDYFSDDREGSRKHLERGGQRVSTLVLYLNDVDAGGETTFPLINFSVKPKKGAAVYFEYCNSLGQVNPMTLHGGSPVIQGEKWIATKWMRQREFA